MKHVPKVFLSYSTEYAAHQQWVIDLGNQLQAHGIKASIDVHELTLGQDMYVFMERITNPEFDRVIILSDASYARKADARMGGVGVEVQLLTQEIYKDVNQKRIIPVYTELDADGEPTLPVFLKGRYALNFSDPAIYTQKYAELYLAIIGESIYNKEELGQRPNLENLKAMTRRKTATTSKKNFIEGEIENIDKIDIGDEDSSSDQGKYTLKNGILGNVKNVKHLRIGDGNKRT